MLVSDYYITLCAKLVLNITLIDIPCFLTQW